MPASKPNVVEAYGPGPLQFGELRLPEGNGPFPVAVVIHGGCWTKGFAGLRNTAPISTALAAQGIATWNIEYRQVGDEEGGWPGTFLDWGAATDHLRTLAKSQPLDLERVVTVGHSVGASASLWLAARHRLAEGSEIRGADPLPLSAAVAIDGPVDLSAFLAKEEAVCGKRVLEKFMGGDPAFQPTRYDEASPMALIPIDVPQYLVSAQVLSADEAAAYADRATGGGDSVEILAVQGAGHFDVIAPGTEAWAKVEPFIVREVLGAGKPPEARAQDPEEAAPQPKGPAEMPPLPEITEPGELR